MLLVNLSQSTRRLLQSGADTASGSENSQKTTRQIKRNYYYCKKQSIETRNSSFFAKKEKKMLLEKKSSNRSLQFLDDALVRNQVRMIKNQEAGTSNRPQTPQFFPKSTSENETLPVENSRTTSQTATPIKRDQNQQTSPRND